MPKLTETREGGSALRLMRVSAGGGCPKCDQLLHVDHDKDPYLLTCAADHVFAPDPDLEQDAGSSDLET